MRLTHVTQRNPMSIQNQDPATTLEPTPPELTPPDAPVESGKQILINWIITALGLGAIGAVGALLPEFL